MSDNDEVQQRLSDGLRLLADGNFSAARQTGQAILQQYGPRPEVLFLVGMAQASEGNLVAGKAMLESARRLAPDNPDVLYNLGVLYQQGGDMPRAADCWEHVLATDPAHLPALKNLVAFALETHAWQDAVSHATRILDHHPQDRDARMWKAFALYSNQQLEDAKACYAAVLELFPQDPEAHYRLGMTLRDLEDVSGSRAALEQAISLNPAHVPAQFEHAHALLVSGEWTRGFAAYEWRRKRENWPRANAEAPFWTGGSLKGKSILVTAEQGHGDTLQFMRYLPLLAQRAGAVSLSAHPGLISLARRFDCLAQVETIFREEGQYDVQVPIMSLAHLFGTTEETVPPPGFPPVEADPRLADLAGAQGRPRVGVVWAGNPVHNRDALRSCPLAVMEDLWRAHPGLQFFSFQVGPQTLEGGSTSPVNLVNLAPFLGSYLDTAGFLAGMDLVISVDTSTLHLAGALGVPTWAILPSVVDWRWMLDRDRSPWYPSMTLWRQTEPGGWAGLLDRVARALNNRFA